jgi:proton-translocating NADH-quinone oxidoreductase chain L
MILLIILLPILVPINIVLFGRYMGNKGVAFYTTFLSLCSFTVSCLLGYEFFFYGATGYISTGVSIKISVFVITYSFVLDGLSSIMLMLVLLISFLVQLYSCVYMENDAHLARFMCYLSLFTFFMEILVTSENLFQLFIGWEGVGLCSFLLISFWFTRTQANSSAIKAFIINRIGDTAFLLALFLLVTLCQTLSFSELNLLVGWCSSLDFIFNKKSIDFLTLVSMLLFVGAMSKSAQIFLHSWLPDAMEGPTPVSALIHAATMVAAGVFLLSKISFFLVYSSKSLSFIVCVGAVSAFFASSVGCFQNDIKKIVAYSTCSQLGYMILAAGLSSFSLSIFHLVNHAFFKAMLFLTCGAIIHSVCDNQDIRKMGGLRILLPFAYCMFFVGSLALMGFPFFSGFYSKDAIVESVLVKFNKFYHLVFSLVVLAAFLTAAYSVKVLALVFFVNTNIQKGLINFIHESGVGLLLPIGVLACFALFFGFFFTDLFLVFNGALFLNTFGSGSTLTTLDVEFLSLLAKETVFCLSLFGVFVSIIVCFFLYIPASRFSFWFSVFSFFSKKWFFDCCYNFFFAYKYFAVAFSVFIQSLDRGFFEFTGPTFIVGLLSQISFMPRLLQTGVIYHYLLLFAVTACSFAFFNLPFSIKLVILLSFVFLLFCTVVRADEQLKIKITIPYKVQVVLATLAGWLHPVLFVLYTIVVAIWFPFYVHRYKKMPVFSWLF